MRNRLFAPEFHEGIELDLVTLDFLSAAHGYPSHDSHIILQGVHLIEEKRPCVTSNDNVATNLDR